MRACGPARRLRAALALAAGLGALVGRPPAARAQTWGARLDISPYPSPYLSDWEANPTIGTLTITNPTSATQNVLLTYRVTDQAGRLLASGRSTPQAIPPGPPTVITDFVDVSGTSQHDQALEAQMRRTGRLPEGENTACVAVTDEGGFVLAQDCQTFSVVYPDPPSLVGPLDGQALASATPVFQWTPLRVPPSFQLTYVVRLSEVLPGQTPLQALEADIPVFETTTFGTSLPYPADAPALQQGQEYAWRVQALDQNGYAASAGEGRSDVWTFQLGEPGGGGAVGGTSYVTLDVANATTGDTTAPADSAGFLSICHNWSASDVPVGAIHLGVSSPVGFPARLRVGAELFRYDIASPKSRVWALVGDAGKYRLLVYGDCDGPADAVPWPHWLGIRTVAGAASMSFLMAGDTTPSDALPDTSTTPGLEFGVVVFAAESQKVEAPEGADVVREFLEDHEFQVAPWSVNAYGVLQLEQRPGWKFFQELGYSEKRVTIQGDVSVGAKWSAGFGVGSAGASARTGGEAEPLTLRVALPDRKPVRSAALKWLVEKMHLELEIAPKVALTDTVSSGGATRKVGELGLEIKVNHVMELTKDAIAFFHLKAGAELEGSIGLDISTERPLSGSASPSSTAGPDDGHATQPEDEGEAETKLVGSYTLNGDWPLGAGFSIGHPKIELDVTASGEHEGDVAVSLSGAVGWGEEAQLGVLGFTVARAPREAVVASTEDVERRDAQDMVGVLQTKLSGLVAQQRRGQATDEQVQTARDDLAAAQRRAAQLDSEPAPATPDSSGAAAGPKWTWAVKANLGNLALSNLIALVRSAAGAVVDALGSQP